MIALASTTFECSIAQAIRSFAARSPERGTSPEPLSLTNAIIGTSNSQSPEPIPIPPRTDSPEPQAYIPRSPTPEGPPEYPAIPEYEDGRDVPIPDYPQDTPYPTTYFVSELTDSILRDIEEEDRQTPSPEGQQPGVHPGVGWILNGRDTGPHPDVIIPDGNHGEQIAPYIQYDLDSGSPEILGTRGCHCTVHSTLLKARPGLYSRPFFTRKQQFTFQDQEVFTPLVDSAVRQEDDISLTAEVQRYRYHSHYVARLADRIGRLKTDLADARWEVRDSACHLTKANVYEHVITQVRNRVQAPGMSRSNTQLAQQQLDDDQFQSTWPRTVQCRWCYRRDHDLQDCTMLKQCLLCKKWGHDEYQCHHPHARCTLGKVCHVAPDHSDYSRPCRAMHPNEWA